MKGALIGTHHTGKTTALAFLTYNLPFRSQVGIGNEVAIDCPYPLNEGGGFLTQWWILVHQIERESKLAKWYPNFITDRGVIDSIVYARVLADKGKMTENEFQQIARTATAWMELFPYDFLIYLSPLDECPIGGSRDYMMELDRQFHLTIASLNGHGMNLQVYPVVHQDKQQRNESILKAVKEAMRL